MISSGLPRKHRVSGLPTVNLDTQVVISEEYFLFLYLTLVVDEVSNLDSIFFVIIKSSAPIHQSVNLHRFVILRYSSLIKEEGKWKHDIITGVIHGSGNLEYSKYQNYHTK